MSYQVLKFGNIGVKVNNSFLRTADYCTLTITTDAHSHVDQSVYKVLKGTIVPFNPSIDSYYRANEYVTEGCSIVDNTITVNNDCSVSITTHENTCTATGNISTYYNKSNSSTPTYTLRGYLTPQTATGVSLDSIKSSIIESDDNTYYYFKPKNCKNITITGSFTTDIRPTTYTSSGTNLNVYCSQGSCSYSTTYNGVTTVGPLNDLLENWRKSVKKTRNFTSFSSEISTYYRPYLGGSFSNSTYYANYSFFSGTWSATFIAP